jgi:hypothetical protein
MFLTRGSAEFVGLPNEPPIAEANCVAGAGALAIAAKAESIEAASGGLADIIGAESIEELGGYTY